MCIVKLGELFFSLAVVNLLEFQFAFPTNIKDVEHSPLEIEVFPTAFNGLLVTGHGGAAITSKDKLETIDEENLKEVSSHLRQAFVLNSTSANVLGMDWSKRSGKSEAPSFVDDFGDQPAGDSESFIVVHGAEGIPSIGMSPFSCDSTLTATKFSRMESSCFSLAHKDTRLKLEDLEAVARKAEIQGCEVCSAENKLQFFFPDILALHFFSYYAHLNGATFVQ
ncbi:putative eukaryotic translation initiation factor 5A-3-like [Capsicum annuum]|nr:putative eukaryotic translation initiation factor 5A-3-like [Capsicum annuum]